MKKLLRHLSIVLFLFIFSLTAHSQKQPNWWYFGIMGGLDFNGGTPLVVNNGMVNTNEGSAAISGTNGGLLFYTEGVNVWNNTHTLMPNGTGLNGDVSTTQSALIVKKPGSANLYYIFTLPAEGSGDFCYSVVDMSLDAGKGDVTAKNTILKSNVTEKMSAVHHCNGTDIWVMIHEWNSKSFYAYPVTSAGVGTPVVSTVGRIHSKVHGQMKFNNNGTKLACARDTIIANGPPYNGKAFLDIHNFNNQTGVVTYSMTLPLNNWQKSYGVEFSLNNQLVYATYYDQSGINGGNSEVIQYNLAAANVAASGVTVGASLDPQILRAMQMGPDGKIYISKSNSPFLCVINTPNALGAACNYTDDAINVDPLSLGAGCMLGLPGFVQSYFNPAFPNINSCPTPTTPTSTVGYSEQSSTVIIEALYVKPVSNQLVIKTNDLPAGPSRVKIFSAVGELCLEKTIEVEASQAGEMKVDLQELPTGIYLLKVSCGNEEGWGRFVKTN